MNTTTELTRRSETNDTYLITVFLTEESDSTQFLCLVERNVTMLIELDVLTNHIVDHTLYLAQLLVADFLKVREVETQGVR